MFTIICQFFLLQCIGRHSKFKKLQFPVQMFLSKCNNKYSKLKKNTTISNLKQKPQLFPQIFHDIRKQFLKYYTYYIPYRVYKLATVTYLHLYSPLTLYNPASGDTRTPLARKRHCTTPSWPRRGT